MHTSSLFLGWLDDPDAKQRNPKTDGEMDESMRYLVLSFCMPEDARKRKHQLGKNFSDAKTRSSKACLRACQPARADSGLHQ